MGVFETGGRWIDRGAGAAWSRLEKLDPIARAALLGATAGAAHGRSQRREDPLTGEKESATQPMIDGALRGAGVGAVGALAVRGAARMWKGASARDSLAAELKRWTRGHRDEKRSQMPQFDDATLEKFCAWLKRRGVAVAETHLHASELKPTQRHFDAAKVRGMVEQYRAGKFPKLYAPLLVSADKFILDGHHRWAAIRMLARLKADAPDDMIVRRIGLPMARLLPLAREFDGVKFRPLKKAAEAFLDETQKLARVFGAEYDPHTIYNPLLTRKDRLKHLSRTIGEKSREKETGWGTALTTGGLSGAALGGLAGAAHGGKGAAIGAGVGGLLGGVVGASLKTRDDQALLHARYLHKRPHLHKRELNELASEHMRARERAEALEAMEADRRHAEMSRKLDRLSERRQERW